MIDTANLQTQDYAQAFRCIGPECEDSCCHGWQITLDQPVLVQLRRLHDPALQAILKNQLILHPVTSPATQAAHFQLTADHNCPCLRPDHLCSIQATHGEAFLPLGCQLFPRVRNRIDHALETSLSLSCPEAARLVLTDPLLFRDCALSPAGLLEAMLQSAATAAPDTLFWPLRRLHLAILLDRSRSMAERLILLGQLAHSMDRDRNAIRALRGLRRALEKNPARHKPSNFAQKASAIAPALLVFVLAAIDAAVAANPHNSRVRALVSCFLSGMEYTPRSTETSLAARYQTLCAVQLDPFLSQYPHLVENYLVNQLIRSLYPFGSPLQSPSNPPGAAFFRQFSSILLEWLFLRIVFAGIAGHHREQLQQHHLVAAAQTLSRTIFHNQDQLAGLQAVFFDRIRGLPPTTLLAL